MERLPESNPHIVPASVEAPALMQYEDHNVIHSELLEVAALLARNTPDSFRTELTGVPLSGTVPLTMRADVGHRYQHLSFNANKDLDEEEDGQVRLWLHGSDPYDQVEFITSSQPVEFGRNKVFGIRPYGMKQPQRSINCDDLCMVLDDVIPDISRRFSSLVDPRTDKSFGSIAAAMGSILSETAKKKTWQYAYVARDHQISIIGERPYDTETEVSLEVTSRDGQQEYSLTATAPVETEDGKINHIFQYSFIRQPFMKRGRVQQPFVPTAKVILSSLEVPAAKLNTYIAAAQADTQARPIVERALSLLLAEHQAA